MNKTLIANEVGRQLWLQQQQGAKKGVMDVVEQFNDQGVLAENARLRQANAIPHGSRVGLHENEKIEYFFRIPTLALYKEFRRLHPDIITMIEDPDESIRMKGAMQMAILQPGWVITKR